MWNGKLPLPFYFSPVIMAKYQASSLADGGNAVGCRKQVKENVYGKPTFGQTLDIP